MTRFSVLTTEARGDMVQLEHEHACERYVTCMAVQTKVYFHNLSWNEVANLHFKMVPISFEHTESYSPCCIGIIY